MAFLVIHLWGKFWMAAWRGRRAMTWITGVVAFVASVVECFTGYLSQQNFDSQWIATNGKDAFNAVGHRRVLQRDELRPDAAVAHRAGADRAGRHRRRARAAGPGPRRQPPAARHARPRPGAAAAAPPGPAAADAAPWRGPTRRYDILKEGTIAAWSSLALTWSAWPACCPRPTCRRSPSQSWAKVGPGRLPGHRGHRTERHQRGRHLRAALQQRHRQRAAAAGRDWQKLAGVTQPVNAAQDFVLGPLAKLAATDPALAAALATYQAAPRRPAAEVGHRLRATRSPR